jgi:hypothetical protein
MSRNQRLMYLAIAAVIAIGAIVVLAGNAGRGDEEAVAPSATATSTATPGSQESATPAPASTPEPPVLRPGRDQEIDVVQGDVVRFRVRVDEADELHVHGYDIQRELPAGKTVSVSFKATITGIFEIELHHAQPPLLAKLKVQPK